MTVEANARLNKAFVEVYSKFLAALIPPTAKSTYERIQIQRKWDKRRRKRERKNMQENLDWIKTI